ncbi:MAG: hypothetical protein K2Y14_13865 [Burkholderiales bacterium]|nr:hypothetical protein [Burkholderiales bacterium]
MLPSEQLRIQYKCDGQTTQFTVPYYFLQDQDLRVAVTDLNTSTTILLKLNSDYTVTGAKSISGGMITTKVKYANNLSLDISRINISLTQLLNLTRNGSLPAESVETSLDKITMLLQQINAAMANTIRVPIDDPLNHNLMLPLAKQRARKFLMFDEQGNISVDYDALAIAEETRQASSSAKSSATASASSAAVSLQHANDSHNYMDESRRFMEQAEAIDLGYFRQDAVGSVDRTFVDKVRETVSVKDFGAVGDGVTDDTAAIQAAINVTIGRIEFVRGEKYRVTSSIMLKSNIIISGNLAQIIDDLSSRSSIFGSNGYVENIIIEQLEFIGDGLWTDIPFENRYSEGKSVGFTTETAAIQFLQSKNILINKNSIRNINQAINISGSENIKITNNNITNTGQSAIRADNVLDITIKDNNINGIFGNTTKPGDVNVNNSKFADGLYLGSVINSVISNNSIQNITRIGVVIDLCANYSKESPKSSNILISNNTITNFVGHRGTELNAAIWVEPYYNDGRIYINDNFICNPNLLEDSRIRGIQLYWGGIAKGNLIQNVWIAINGDSYSFIDNQIKNVVIASSLTDYTPNDNTIIRQSIITNNIYDEVGAALTIVSSGTPPLDRVLDFSKNIINVSNKNINLNQPCSDDDLDDFNYSQQPILSLTSNNANNNYRIVDNVINNNSTFRVIVVRPGDASKKSQNNGTYLIKDNVINNSERSDAILFGAQQTGYNVSIINNECMGSVSIIDFTSTDLNQYNILVKDNQINSSNGYGVYISLSKSGQVGNLKVTLQNNNIQNSALAGIRIMQSTTGNINGYVNINNNTIVDCAASAVSEYDKSAILLQHATAPALCHYFINNNLLITSASATSTTGQLYGICQMNIGSLRSTSAFIRNNTFIFNGQISNYPQNLNIKPSSLSFSSGYDTDIPMCYDVLNANSNINSKLPILYGAKEAIKLNADGIGQTFLGFMAQSPTSSNYKNGDYVLNVNPDPDVVTGWMFTAGGWKSFK